jgi:hypothetical protein
MIMRATKEDRLGQAQPTTIDALLAHTEYEAENPGQKFMDLSKRQRNLLAKDQMYHREYRELADFITQSKAR